MNAFGGRGIWSSAFRLLWPCRRTGVDSSGHGKSIESFWGRSRGSASSVFINVPGVTLGANKSGVSSSTGDFLIMSEPVGDIVDSGARARVIKNIRVVQEA